MKLFQTLAEGGQTWAHRMRMVRQVLKIALGTALLSGACYAVCALATQDRLLVQSGYYYVKGEASRYLLLKEVSVRASFWERISHERGTLSTKSLPIARLQLLTREHARHFVQTTQTVALTSLRVACGTLIVMLAFFLIRGTASKKRHHISGKKQIHPSLLHLKLVLQRKNSPLKIGTLPLIKGTETQHILVTGGTGSGKTNCFHTFLPQLRAEGQKALIIDTSGAFADRYYRPGKDIILNPFDRCGAPWHPWIECTHPFDFDNLAESIIPQTHNDHENYWRTAARTLLSCVLRQTADRHRATELVQWLLYAPLDALAGFVQGTKAAAHIDPNSEKTAASIRSVTASFLSCFEYIQDTTAPFSVKQWVQTADQDSWLFLHVHPAQRAALNPLLSCWFSIAVRSLLQMSPSRDRRLWFVLDELPVLQKLKELESLVTESRKYGGCAFLALQSPAQLEEIYGRNTAKTLIGNCATRVVFAEHDPEIAERISRSLGESEIKEYQEGISYGAHEMRDGVNLSLQTKKSPIVSPTDIQSLQNNHAYIKLPGNIPLCKLKLKILT